MIIETDSNPPQVRATLAQRATFMTTRTPQTTADAKPMLKKLSNDTEARSAYNEEKSSKMIQRTTRKDELTPDMLDAVASG